MNAFVIDAFDIASEDRRSGSFSLVCGRGHHVVLFAIEALAISAIRWLSLRSKAIKRFAGDDPDALALALASFATEKEDRLAMNYLSEDSRDISDEDRARRTANRESR